MKPEIKAYLSEIGTKGGHAKSDKKTAACRANAKKPRKKKLAAIAKNLLKAKKEKGK